MNCLGVILIILLVNSFCYGQEKEYTLYDFTKTKNLKSENLHSGQIEFTLDLQRNTSLRDFTINFDLPSNINLYNKKLLNRSESKTSYFQTTHGKIIDDKKIMFSYPAINSEKGLLIYFHVVPVLSDSENIIAEFNWVDSLGNRRNESVKSGMIYSLAPPIEKIIALKESDVKYRLKAKLKYEHDYEGYVPDGANYFLTFKSAEGKEYRVHSSSISVVSGQRTEYNVTGEINYGSTAWKNINQNIVLDGRISTEEVIASKTEVTKTAAAETPKFVFKNDFLGGVSLSKGIFQEYMLGLNMFKVNLVDSWLSLVPSKVTLYQSFKKKSTSLAFGQELLISQPWVNNLKFSLGIEENALLFPINQHASATSINFGVYYEVNEDYSMHLLVKKHDRRLINSNIFFCLAKTF